MWMGVMGRRIYPPTRSEGLQVSGFTGNSTPYTPHPTLTRHFLSRTDVIKATDVEIGTEIWLIGES